jgi:hypothetical protein
VWLEFRRVLFRSHSAEGGLHWRTITIYRTSGVLFCRYCVLYISFEMALVHHGTSQRRTEEFYCFIERYLLVISITLSKFHARQQTSQRVVSKVELHWLGFGRHWVSKLPVNSLTSFSRLHDHTQACITWSLWLLWLSSHGGGEARRGTWGKYNSEET